MSQKKHSISIAVLVLISTCLCQPLLGQTALTPSEAALIALDSATAQIKRDQIPFTNLRLEQTGVVYSLEQSDENDHYLFLIKLSITPDSVVYGKIFVHCTTGEVMLYTTARNPIHLISQESYNLYRNEMEVSSLMHQVMPESCLQWWSLIMVSAHTVGSSVAPHGKKEPLNAPPAWQPPPVVLVADTNDNYYFVTPRGVRMLTDLDPAAVLRIRMEILQKQ